MTGAALNSRNDDWPDRPSLTPAPSKSPVSPHDDIADMRQRRHRVGPVAGAVIAVGIAHVLRGRVMGSAGCLEHSGRSAQAGAPGSQQAPSASSLAASSLTTEVNGRWQPEVTPRHGAATSRPSIAPARAVVLTSLFPLVPVAMNLRLSHRRTLHAIERNLANSDPTLTK